MEICEHPDERLYRQTYTNGIEHVVLKCPHCGHHFRSVSKASFTPDEYQALPEWDESIRQRYHEQRQAHWERESEERRLEITREYHAYLQTPQWRQRRARRLALDGGRCQAQLDGCTGHATEVHHLDYKLRPEPLFNLVSVCRTCHEQISRMEGRIREDEPAAD